MMRLRKLSSKYRSRFRKGKVPRGLFEQRFGVESLYQRCIRYSSSS
ncbi:trigger factor [Bacillus sp. SL00103]